MTPLPVVIGLRAFAKAAATGGQRTLFFEASRDNVVDREGEMVALDALWASRDLFLAQGNLDISHWSWLPNPLTGLPMPEYVIGRPLDVRRRGDGLFVKGEIFSNLTPPPEGSSGDWADKFWHSVTGQVPPDRWFPSVYGFIHPDGKIVEDHRGRPVRKIVKVDWTSVGFARRAQHPELGEVRTTDAGGVFAKAVRTVLPGSAREGGALHLSWGRFAKAVQGGLLVKSDGAPAGLYQTEHAGMTGVAALRSESLEAHLRRVVPHADAGVTEKAARVVILRGLKSGAVPHTLAGVKAACAHLGVGGDCADRLWRDLKD